MIVSSLCYIFDKNLINVLTKNSIQIQQRVLAVVFNIIQINKIDFIYAQSVRNYPLIIRGSSVKKLYNLANRSYGSRRVK